MTLSPYSKLYQAKILYSENFDNAVHSQIMGPPITAEGSKDIYEFFYSITKRKGRTVFRILGRSNPFVEEGFRQERIFVEVLRDETKWFRTKAKSFRIGMRLETFIEFVNLYKKHIAENLLENEKFQESLREVGLEFYQIDNQLRLYYASLLAPTLWRKYGKLSLSNNETRK